MDEIIFCIIAPTCQIYRIYMYFIDFPLLVKVISSLGPCHIASLSPQGKCKVYEQNTVNLVGIFSENFYPSYFIFHRVVSVDHNFESKIKWTVS